jgi:hypothetical protein
VETESQMRSGSGGTAGNKLSEEWLVELCETELKIRSWISETVGTTVKNIEWNGGKQSQR